MPTVSVPAPVNLARLVDTFTPPGVRDGVEVGPQRGHASSAARAGFEATSKVTGGQAWAPEGFEPLTFCSGGNPDFVRVVRASRARI